MTAVLSVTLDSLGTIDARIAVMMASFPQRLGQAMFTSAYDTVVPAVQAQIRANTSVFRGGLHQRVSPSVTVSNTGAVLVIGSLGVQYGLFVEEGSLPRVMSAAEIRQMPAWVMAKGITPDPVIAARIAWNIIRAIQSKGNKPHPYLVPAWVATRDAFFAGVLARF